MATYLVYRIHKGLGIFPIELFNRLNLIVVQEDRRDQRYALVRGEEVIDQPFPHWVFTAHEGPFKLTNMIV